mgnify:FL=1
MIPKVMADATRWVLWRREQRDGNDTKVPYDAKNFQRARSNDESTWCDYETARNVLHSGDGFNGLGFVLGGGFAGVDIDGCIDESGSVQPWAWSIIRALDTYCEVSPSGTGVKLFMQADLTKGRKKQLGSPVDGGKTPGIEIYSTGRYFTVTSESLHVADDCEPRQQQLDALIAEHWPEQPRTLPATIPTCNNSYSVADRARLYLQQIEPAVSGQRGHDVTFKAACALLIGFALSIDEARPLLAEWNQGCLPPWSERELDHKLESAEKTDGERGYLLRDRDYGLPQADLSGFETTATVKPDLIVEEDEPSDENDEDKQLPLPPGNGLMNSFIEHVQSSSIYPQDEIALAAALALMAVITGRKVRDRIGTRTNLYLICCAPSGSGKDFARQCLKDLLMESGPEATELLGPERLASHAGLISELKETPCKLFPLDECHRLIVTMKDAKTPHLFNIGSLFLTLWSSSSSLWIGDAYGDRDKTPRIWCPHPVIFGSSTTEGLWNSLDSVSMSDGLVARFCEFSGEYQLPVEIEPKEFSSTLVDRVRWWSKFAPGGDLAAVNPTPIKLAESKETSRRLFEHSYKIAEKRIGESKVRAALWSRANEKARKFALLSACSRATPGLEPVEIDMADADWGIALANELTRRMLRKAGRFVAENDTERNVKRILETLREAGGELTWEKLSKATDRLTKKQRDDLIASIADSGRLSVEVIPTGKRPRRIVRLVGVSAPKLS